MRSGQLLPTSKANSASRGPSAYLLRPGRIKPAS